MKRQSTARRYLALVILVCGALVYANSFRGAFVLDDSKTVEENPRIRHVIPSGTEEWLAWRLAADVTFALNYRTGGLRPADYHATNLLIHLLAGLTLFGFMRRTLRRPCIPQTIRTQSDLLAFWTAVLWVVHPITTAAVTYVSQRYESLMSLCLLGVLYCVVRSSDSLRPRMWQRAAVVLGLVGVACKEIMIVAPVLALVYDRTFLAGGFGQALKKRWGMYLGLALIWVYFGILTLLQGSEASIAGTMTATVSPFEYALTESAVIAHYLRLMVQPWAMSIDYGWPLANSIQAVLPGGAVTVALVLIAAVLFVRRSLFGFALFAFLCLLAPTSSVIPRPDPAFDHRMYLASACVVAAVVIGGYVLWQRVACHRFCWGRRPWSAVPVLLVVGALCALGVETRRRNALYSSRTRIWEDVVRKHPENLRAYQNLAAEAVRQGRYQEALALCNEVIQRVPDFGEMSSEEFDRLLGGDSRRVAHWVFEWANAKNTEGIAEHALGHIGAALAAFREAVRLTPGNRIAQANLEKASAALSAGEEADNAGVNGEEGTREIR